MYKLVDVVISAYITVRQEVRYEQGWVAQQKGCKLISKPHIRHRQESSQICYKITTGAFPTPAQAPQAHKWIQTNHRGFRKESRQVGANQGFINILYIYTFDYNRLNYGKTNTDKYNSSVTCNCQLALDIYLFAFPFLIGGGYKPSFAQGTTRRKSLTRAKSLQPCRTLCNPMNCSPPALCPWDAPGKNTGVGCMHPGDLPDPGIKPISLMSPASL